MKKLLIGGMLALYCLMASAQTFKVATYNLRNENTYDVGNLWKDRCPYVVKLITYHDFDFFGTQEALPGQLKDLQQALPSYTYYGEGRDGNGEGEHTAVFYKADKYNLLNKGDFWLSATPDVPSKSWDAPCCNRICTWLELEEKYSGKRFFVFNAHYDYEKDYAREQSSLLVLQKIKEIAGNSPVIFMGDLNGGVDDSWCKILQDSDILKNTYFEIKEPYATSASYNAFGRFDTLGNSDKQMIKDKKVIDHIFFTKHFKAERWGLLTDTYDTGKFPSDHFPVLVNASWVE